MHTIERSPTSRLLVGAVLLAAAACGVETSPVGPEPGSAVLGRGGNGGGGGPGGGADGDTTVTLVADVVALDGSQVASTCPAEVNGNFGADFGHSGCLVVPLDGYALTDDLAFQVKTRKGEILEMILVGQDVVGDAGIMHETDNLLPAPVPTSVEGFTVQIRATVPVYRLSGHLRGRRVGVAGHVSLGDVVYRPVR